MRQRHHQALSESTSLDKVICTDALKRRTARAPDHAAENIALVRLAQEMAHSPQEILQSLTDVALQLCRAGSAGISIIEGSGEGSEAQVFRWHALSGALASLLWGTTPRDFSPCGTVVDRKAVQLMRGLGRHFRYLGDIRPKIVEALLVPFTVDGRTIGTVWAVMHNAHDKFDSEDVRLLENLAAFTAAAYQLRTSLDASKEIDRRKDEFVATVAHELRNPLAAVTAASRCLELGLRTLEEPQLQAMNQVAQRQLNAMNRMIDDLLDVTRIRLDKLELRKEIAGIDAIVQQAVDSCRSSIDMLAHELNVALPSQALWVHADPVRLTQVISNLLDNAAKYTPRGGRIELDVREADGQIVLRIRDNGIGISNEMLPHIFDLFTQVDASLTHSNSGLGIGLTLVRRLVELHGGHVQARSKGLGQGSEFTVRLPLVTPLCEATPEGFCDSLQAASYTRAANSHATRAVGRR